MWADYNYSPPACCLGGYRCGFEVDLLEYFTHIRDLFFDERL